MTHPVLTELYATGLIIYPYAPDEEPTETTPHVLRVTGVAYTGTEEYEREVRVVMHPDALRGLVLQAVEALAAAGQPIKLKPIITAARAGRATEEQR